MTRVGTFFFTRPPRSGRGRKASHCPCFFPRAGNASPRDASYSVQPQRKKRSRRLRRPCLVERAWVRVACEAVGATKWSRSSGCPPRLLPTTIAPGVARDDRRLLDLVIYGASPVGGVLCCGATLVSRLTRTGQPQPGTACRTAPCCGLPSGASEPPTQAQLRRSGASPRAGLRDRRALERSRAAARQRLGARSSPTGPAGTASSSRFRLDETVVGQAVQQAASSAVLESPWPMWPVPPHKSELPAVCPTSPKP